MTLFSDKFLQCRGVCSLATEKNPTLYEYRMGSILQETQPNWNTHRSPIAMTLLSVTLMVVLKKGI